MHYGPNPCALPLTYSDHAADEASWNAGRALTGRKVRVTLRGGGEVVGKVLRYELSGDRTRRFYGVGFLIAGGYSDRPIAADAYSRVEALREPDYIRV